MVLVFALLGLTAKLRRDAMAAGVRPHDVALSGEAFPPHARQAANCYANQFEMPVLFLAAVAFGIVLHQTGWLFVLLEWVVGACRIAHAVVHTTRNDVTLRGALFLGSAVATALLWLLIFIGIISTTGMVIR